MTLSHHAISKCMDWDSFLIVLLHYFHIMRAAARKCRIRVRGLRKQLASCLRCAPLISPIHCNIPESIETYFMSDFVHFWRVSLYFKDSGNCRYPIFRMFLLRFYCNAALPCRFDAANECEAFQDSFTQSQCKSLDIIRFTSDSRILYCGMLCSIFLSLKDCMRILFLDHFCLFNILSLHFPSTCIKQTVILSISLRFCCKMYTCFT